MAKRQHFHTKYRDDECESHDRPVMKRVSIDVICGDVQLVRKEASGAEMNFGHGTLFCSQPPLLHKKPARTEP